MSESNYNFRNALNEAKLTKKTQVSLEADKVLRNFISVITSSSKTLISNLFLVINSTASIRELVFCQTGAYINIYIRNLNARERDKFPFEKFAYYCADTFDDATNIIVEVRNKLRTEEFSVEEYELPREIGINAFKVFTEER